MNKESFNKIENNLNCAPFIGGVWPTFPVSSNMEGSQQHAFANGGEMNKPTDDYASMQQLEINALKDKIASLEKELKNTKLSHNDLAKNQNNKEATRLLVLDCRKFLETAFEADYGIVNRVSSLLRDLESYFYKL